MTGNSNEKLRALILSALMVFSVFAGTVALSGTAAAAANSELTEGQTVFQGQVVERTSDINADETLEIRDKSDDSLVTQLTANSSGGITIDTATVNVGDPLPEGQYALVNDTGDTIVNFEIAKQSLKSSISADSVNNEGDNNKTTFSFQSSRADYDATVTVEDADGNVVSSLTNTTTNGDSSVVLNFTGVATGDYTVIANVNDTTASSSKSVTVSDLGDTSVSLVSNTVRQNQGDIAALNISFTNTDTAYLSVGGPDAGYQFNTTITDDDGDGYAVVNLNTYSAGTNRGGILAGVDSGSNGTVSETNLPSIIAQGDYEIGVDKNNVGEATDDPDKVGTLFVRPRSTDSIQLWRSGQSDDSFDSAAAIKSAVDSGSLSQSTTYNAGDTQVHQISASGLEGLIANKSGASTTDKFLKAVGDGDLSLVVKQTDDSTRQNRGQKVLDAAKAQSNTDLRVVAAPQDDTYYVVLNTGTGAFQRGGTGSYVSASSGDVFDVSFTVSKDSDIASADQTVTTQFDIGASSASLSQDNFQLESDSGQTISGTSTFAPGKTMRIKVESQDPENPFVDRRDATVQSDGSFEADFDLSSLPEGTELEITLTDPNDGTSTSTGQIASPASFEVSNLDAPATAQVGDTVTVTADITNTGDVEGSTDAQFVLAGDVVTDFTQTLTIAGGETQTVTFELPVEDIDPGTYTHGVQVDGDADSRVTADITIEEQSTTQPPTTTEPPATTTEPPATTTTESTTTEDTTTEDMDTTTEDMDTTTEDVETTEDMETTEDEGTTEPEDGGQPGFTMGVGIVALLAAALLALRRRN